MTNFIYIFMIIALIGIGVGIKAFNSEDSDTKTNVKNIPRGLKKALQGFAKRHLVRRREECEMK